ncbi:hypothetical protein NDU88_000244 [Pleurodeles waltl]|uniref:Uncharacterized protein n=1 Tax=Pleurodeles waltl TaxID=8319 RepID=A0AAV7MHB7_PLEWA|nr:hypothetical protein NDU88_000244 [Pleurodeles waltl]
MTSRFMGCQALVLGFGVPLPAASGGARLWGAIISFFMGSSALGCNHQLLGFGVPSAAASRGAWLWCSVVGCHHQLLHGLLGYGVPPPAA